MLNILTNIYNLFLIKKLIFYIIVTVITESWHELKKYKLDMDYEITPDEPS